MEFRQYGEALNIVLHQLLEADDKDKYYPLWNALYDWGNIMMFCLGAIQLLRDSNQQTPTEGLEDILEETQIRLKYLIREMRTGIGVKYTAQSDSVDNQTKDARDITQSSE